MSTYKEIKGNTVQYLSSDPPASHVGQVWYNTSSNQLKYNTGAPRKAWATKPKMIIEKLYGGYNGSGVSNAIYYGGQGGPNQTTTLVWNDPVWTTGNPISSTSTLEYRYAGAGAGTSNTTGLYSGGYNGNLLPNCESWNGTTWTAVNAMPEGKFGVGGSGSSTAAIGVAGYSPPSFTISSSTYIWNGSNWTSPGANITRGNTAYACAFGPSGASVLSSGGGGSNTTEFFNGTSWTSNPAGININRGGRGGDGTQTSAIVVGGSGPADDKAETWNGSTWSATVDLLSNMAPANTGVTGGSATTAFAFGGPPNIVNCAELQTIGGTTVLG
mgnify:CR=1 FL=1